jgi:hypothetical protein
MDEDDHFNDFFECLRRGDNLHAATYLCLAGFNDNLDYTRAELSDWFNTHVFIRLEDDDAETKALVTWLMVNRFTCSDDPDQVEARSKAEEAKRKRRREHAEKQVAYHEEEAAKWRKELE